MDKNFVENVIKFLKEQGLIGVLCLLLIYFFGSFSTQLAEIQKEILQIKITLAKMEEKYAEKEQVRNMIEIAIEKHERNFHYSSYSNNSNN